MIFNIVFFCTLISLLLQGTTIVNMAKWLNLAQIPVKIKKLREFDVEFSDEIKSVTTEIEIREEMLGNGPLLMDLPLPEKTLVVMVKRDNKYFIPTGKTVLLNQDKLLVITDDHEALIETYKCLKVENNS